MTIRIRCAECQRKLKVPDEALGKKVQCPACGARFIGKLDTPPPAQESPPPLQQPPLEMMAAASNEEPAPAPTPPQPPLAPALPNLELEEPPLDAEPAPVEAIEPAAIEEADVVEEAAEVEAVNGVEPIVEEAAEVEAVDGVEPIDEEAAVVEAVDGVEPIVVEEAAPAPAAPSGEPLDPIILDDEPSEEVEAAEEADVEERPARRGKQPPQKKKSRGLLCGCIAGIGFVMLLVCGVGGFFGYRWYTGYISDDDWKMFAVPQARCALLMPGEPKLTEEPISPRTVKHKYTIEKPWARSEFHFFYWDLLPEEGPGVLETRTDEEASKICNRLGGNVSSKRSFDFGRAKAREARLDLNDGRTGFVRLYFASGPGYRRLYEVFAVAPKLTTTDGVGGKFFNSFSIYEAAPNQPGPNRPPMGPPGRNR